MNRKRIYLIGYMGCGKTSIGKRLAESLDMQFIDLDAFIENRYHKSIDVLFSELGEQTFRTLENKTLHEVSEFENVIIATGGGTPCFCNNMELMLGTGETIYLKTSAGTLAERLNKAKNKRPLIKDKSTNELKDFICNSLNGRENFYQQAAYIYDTEAMTTEKDLIATVDYLISLLSQKAL